MTSKIRKIAAATALLTAMAWAQAAKPAASGKAGGELESVLTQMDRAAAGFKGATADFVWEQYQKVVDETDTQKGKIYFRRNGKTTEMAADITEPEKKQVLFSEGKIRLYQPKIEQVTEKEVGANQSEVESFLVLGFGGRGHDLPKSFEVKFQGWEQVDGVKTAKLELVPKAAKVRTMFERITVWVDPARGVSLRQQAFEPAGDYRLAHYKNIQVNAKAPDEAFKLKTTGKTKVVRP